MSLPQAPLGKAGKNETEVSPLKLLVKKLNEAAQLPRYATPGSAGMDLRACLDAPVTLAPGQRAKIPTGLAIALPGPEWVALLCARSGLAVSHGVTLPNCVGVIDSDYRGELIVALVNLSGESCTIRPGDRIAQMLLLPVAQAQLVETDALPDTGRGSGGFGSTGRA